ncbi:unnamed protein product [Brachionus calyciflorus]|uniref:Uncharacterized protein n=1 Tax=Brachionus calyciflorus TaxID=104777 RepID=A0A813TK88_9BILA|nr:unnamed protein product [Brachionus calyciflorus]
MENTLDEAAAQVTEAKTESGEWDPFSTQEERSDGNWADFGARTQAQDVGVSDEWADFVETPKQTPINPLLSLIENFLNSKNEINFCEKSIPEKELNLNCDSTWNELKKYTSINDESISLKFKWSLSNLEDEYLKSLNLQRQIPQAPIRKPNNNFMLSTEILQPIKIDLTNTNSDVINEIQISDENHVNTDPVNEITTSTLNIDLSFFESNQEPNDVIDQDSKSKTYLNKLLTEIYANNNTNGSLINGLESKDDDLNSDKKSITSVTSNHSTRSNSSSSRRLNQSSIKLEPHNLEKQFNIISLSDLNNQNIYP